MSKRGRKKLPDHLRKENITFRLPNWLITTIKSFENYNVLVEKVLTEYFSKKDKN